MESKYSPTSIQAATAKVLKLFAEFKSEYGDLFEYKKHRFTSAKAREWAVELLEAGINAEQYQYGRYQAVKNQKYPIERGYDFIQLCKQATTSKYPDMRQAYLDAAQGKHSHEVTLETAKRVGSWELKTQPESISYKAWQKHYPQVCDEHSSGASFKVPKSHRIEQQHVPVQVGSDADKRISEQLKQIMKVAV